MIIGILISLINITICYMYNILKTKEDFSLFMQNKKINLLISTSVVFVLSIFYFYLK